MLRLKAKVFSFSGDSYKIVDANDNGKATGLPTSLSKLPKHLINLQLDLAMR